MADQSRSTSELNFALAITIRPRDDLCVSLRPAFYRWWITAQEDLVNQTPMERR